MPRSSCKETGRLHTKAALLEAENMQSALPGACPSARWERSERQGVSAQEEWTRLVLSCVCSEMSQEKLPATFQARPADGKPCRRTNTLPPPPRHPRLGPLWGPQPPIPAPPRGGAGTGWASPWQASSSCVFLFLPTAK